MARLKWRKNLISGKSSRNYYPFHVQTLAFWEGSSTLFPELEKNHFIDEQRVCKFSTTSCMYKIVAGVRFEQLKVLPHTITIFQSTFVIGRQILDASLSATELIDEREKGGGYKA